MKILNIKQNTLFIFLCLIFILEGMGLPNGRTITFYLILIMPLFLFARKIILGTKIYFPNKISILFLLFFIFSSVSVIISKDLQIAFEYFFYYLASFMVLVYAYNEKGKLEKGITYFLIAFSFILVLYSSLLPLLNNSYLIPNHGYQFSFSTFGSHNHLGDFLVLTIVTLLYFLQKAPKYKTTITLAIVFFVPVFLLSYSRSAYINIVILGILGLYFFRKPKIHIHKSTLLLGILLIITSLIFFFSTTSDFKIYPFNKAHGFLSSKLQLTNKVFTGQREYHITTAITAIKERPLFGLGPGNFYIVSEEKTPRLIRSQTSHNIFLDIFVENGLAAGIVFLLIIIMVLRKLKFEPISIIFAAMILNFQTDYTHRILSYFLLLMILIGLIYNEKRYLNVTKIVFLCSSLLALVSIFIFIYNIFPGLNIFYK